MPARGTPSLTSSAVHAASRPSPTSLLNRATTMPMRRPAPGRSGWNSMVFIVNAVNIVNVVNAVNIVNRVNDVNIVNVENGVNIVIIVNIVNIVNVVNVVSAAEQ